MANYIYIDVSQFTKGIEQIKSLEKKVIENVDAVLDANARAIELKAKQNLARPHPEGAYDMGGLANSVSADNSKHLEKHITVNAFYAAFVEFGSGKYAAQYVSTLPESWREFASKFKGQKGSGTLDDFLIKMVEWVKRRGIHGITKSGRSRKGKKADADAYNIAYVIVISILRNGVHPHPFLFPAFEGQRQTIIKDIENALKGI